MRALKNKRKICVVVNSRANYGRIKSVLSAIVSHPELELQLIVGASALLYRFGNVQEVIEKDGFKINAKVYLIVEGENPTTMAKSTGMAIMELATIFENLKPDLVITVADRFETIATAVAASYMNIMLVHTQGGETTGSIDEGVRHAVTKLSHIHFTATKRASQYVIRMGENPAHVFHTGCPSIDILANIDLSLNRDLAKRGMGVGPDVDLEKSYIVVLQHPVTTEYGDGYRQINETVKAVESLRIQTVWLWPNVDAGSDDLSKCLRIYREREKPNFVHFFKNFSVEDYARVIKNTVCIVGNSSSALREGAFLGTPAVNIGTRQAGRESGHNVLHVTYDATEIEEAISRQIKNGKYEPTTLFGDGNASERIAEILAKIEVNIQKKLYY